MPTFGIRRSHHDTALDVHASQLFELAESIRHRTDSLWRTFTNSTPVLALLVRPFHPIGHVLVAVISFVNLFHAIEGAFALAHFFVNDSEVVDGFLFRPIHR